MRKRALAFTLFALALGASPALAAHLGGCVEGGCHKAIVSAKFLHGPVGAEFAGGEGCVSCHVLAGAPCTPSKGGRYTFKTNKDRLCVLCHERGTSTQHTRARSDCLACHDPHFSNQSEKLLRAGKTGGPKQK